MASYKFKDVGNRLHCSQKNIKNEGVEENTEGGTVLKEAGSSQMSSESRTGFKARDCWMGKPLVVYKKVRNIGIPSLHYHILIHY